MEGIGSEQDHHLGCQPNLSPFPILGPQTGSCAMLLCGPKSTPSEGLFLNFSPTDH